MYFLFFAMYVSMYIICNLNVTWMCSTCTLQGTFKCTLQCTLYLLRCMFNAHWRYIKCTFYALTNVCLIRIVMYILLVHSMYFKCTLKNTCQSPFKWTMYFLRCMFKCTFKLHKLFIFCPYKFTSNAHYNVHCISRFYVLVMYILHYISKYF